MQDFVHQQYDVEPKGECYNIFRLRSLIISTNVGILHDAFPGLVQLFPSVYYRYYRGP